MRTFSTSSVGLVSLWILSVARGQGPNQTSLEDPRERYDSNFTFPDQSFPGLQSNWGPVVPDCGETSYVGSGRLQGRRALITGGDSGIGRAVAITFAREGADVVINHLSEEQSDADDVISIIESSTESRIFSIAGDLRNQTFCEELVHESAELMGGLDILINNAGYALLFPNITEQTPESFQQTIETNIYAPFYLTRAAAPLLPPGSSIVFTSSLIFEAPSYAAATYAASKAFLFTYARGLASGLLPTQGIKVNAVRPGAILTNFHTSQGQTQEQTAANARMLPLGRIQHPIEIAPQFLALVENDSSYATGGMY